MADGSEAVMTEDEFGRRLRRARAVAGLSRGQVATALAVRRSDVARIEHGRRLVSTIELTRLARLYRKPSARSLLEPADPQPLERFRSDYRLDDRDLMVIEQAADWLDYYAWLERAAFGAHRYRFPTYPPLDGDPARDGERLAAEERHRLRLRGDEPVASMVPLLEGEGVKVVVEEFHPKSSVSGCFLFSEDLGPCVIVNRTRPCADRRIATAHAYAHLLLDQEDVSGGVCGPFRAQDPDELRADAFARAFLSPPGATATPAGESSPGKALGPAVDAWRGQAAGAADPSPDNDSFTLTRCADSTGGDGEPRRFRWVAVEAWRCGRISIAKLAGLLGLPEADVALLLDQSPFEHGRPDRAPSPESDGL
jgi:transcriptional regulator with XRE-family HTH domain